ncbi:type II toxin-antitoxin system VapC family toxin [Nostocoides veronense]|uniref:Ribonuclease VapC n=1 Tax=Nostocoides veronense TaxID=330836 RepID=A0ABP4Y5E8_9MICO
MLVVDASAVAEILLGTAKGRVAASLLGDQVLIAPQHLSVEVMSVLRGWSLSSRLTEEEALTAITEFRALGIELVPMDDLLPEVWRLRHSISAYDACYVVLARACHCQLLTLDTRLASNAPDCAMSV